MKTDQEYSKAEYILKKIQEYVGGSYKVSSRNNPRLVFNNTYSVYYMGWRKMLVIFIKDKDYKLCFKQWPDVVRYLHFVLNFKWTSKLWLDDRMINYWDSGNQDSF